jgi:hypothetical protein
MASQSAYMLASVESESIIAIGHCGEVLSTFGCFYIFKKRGIFWNYTTLLLKGLGIGNVFWIKDLLFTDLHWLSIAKSEQILFSAPLL